MDIGWRLILDDDRSAALNMAVDEAIFRACAGGEVPPTLRLYGWTIPSISLGFFQDIEASDLNLEYCREKRIQLVRRLTGGRAVLHGHDLTFSVALREEQLPPDSRGVLKSHRWLMEGIMGGLRKLKVPGELGPADDVAESARTADCFGHIARCDVRVGKEKLVGAAQVRKWNALLEQGSIPCTLPKVDVRSLFPGRSRESGQFLAGFPMRRIRDSVVSGMEQTLGLSFTVQPLTDSEMETALELEKTRYSLPKWTHRQEGHSIDNTIPDCYTYRVSLRGGRYHAEENPRR